MKFSLIQLIVPLFVLTPFIRFFEKYVWNDWQFAGTMFMLVAIDTALGFYFAWKNGTVSSKKMWALGTKIIVYGLSLATIHNISHHTVHGDPNNILAAVLPWLDATVYAYFVIRETLSINENCGKLGFPLLPVFITKRFHDFNESGKFEKQETQNQNDNNNK